MIVLEKSVPPVYVDDSRDFQYFLRAYNVILNAVKQDTDSLAYLTSTRECQSKILPLLKTKVGFFTDYNINDEVLRKIIDGFPIMVKNKGALIAIEQAVHAFLKALNIKTEIVIKAVGAESEVVKGNITVDDHTILIAVNSAIQNFYILEELFRYIMPIGYQYVFYFYKEIERESWLLNIHTGRFLIVSTLIADSIRSENFYNQDYYHEYNDPYIDRMLNQINTINIYPPYREELDEEGKIIEVRDFVLTPLAFEPSCFRDCFYYFYKKEGNKYVQLEHPETWVNGLYYIPQFFFSTKDGIDKIEIDPETGEETITKHYVLLEEEPIIEYSSRYKSSEQEPVEKTESYSLFKNEYFNYYTLDDDGYYRNLKEPVDFIANKYYKVNTPRVKAIANDVFSWTAIPMTSTYISTIAEMIDN